MPRNPDNNPTERMLRMIAEYDAWVEWAEYLYSHFSDAERRDLPPRPKETTLASEKTRQEISKTYTQSQRDYKRRVRMLAQDHGVHLDSASRRQFLQRGGAAHGIDEPPPQQTRSSLRRSIVDEDKPLDADAEALVEQLKNANFTFAQPTKEEVLARYTPEAMAKLSEKEQGKARLDAVQAGAFFTSPKPEDDGTA